VTTGVISTPYVSSVYVAIKKLGRCVELYTTSFPRRISHLLSVMLLTSNAATADGIGHLIQESGVFKLVSKGSRIPSTHEVIRLLGMHDPELILLDLGEWDAVSALAHTIKRTKLRGVVIGFRPTWNRLEQLTFEDAGIKDLLRDPFSHYELETVAYDALHRGHAVASQNIVALLPAKAGGGCSTIALNTAAALAEILAKRVLLIRCPLDYAESEKSIGARGGSSASRRDDAGGVATTLRLGVRDSPASGEPHATRPVPHLG
jgi:hypothetical protein